MNKHCIIRISLILSLFICAGIKESYSHVMFETNFQGNLLFSSSSNIIFGSYFQLGFALPNEENLFGVEFSPKLTLFRLMHNKKSHLIERPFSLYCFYFRNLTANWRYYQIFLGFKLGYSGTYKYTRPFKSYILRVYNFGGIILKGLLGSRTVRFNTAVGCFLSYYHENMMLPVIHVAAGFTFIPHKRSSSRESKPWNGEIIRRKRRRDK